MMEKSQELWSQIQDVFSKLDSLDKPFADSVAYEFMITSIYSEFESCLEKIFHEKMESDNTWTNKYLSANNIHRGLAIKDISRILRSMNLLEKEENLVNQEVTKTHSDFLKIRHPMTHEGLSIDINALPIENIISNSKTILEAISSRFASHR